LNTFDFVSFLNPPGPISVYASNNELKILSILVFFAAAGLKPVRRMYAVSIVSIATIFLLSFFTIGIDFPAQGVVNLVHVHSEAIQFGIPLALLALMFAYWLPKLMTHVVFGGTIFVLLTAPWIFQYWYRLVEYYQLPRAKKFLVRGEIWDAVSIQALKAPFFGHGLDSTRYQNSVRFEQKYYMGEQVWHPHNMFLQIWLDMGLTGVAFVLAFLLFSWRATLSIPLAKRPAILAGVVMLITFALVTHSIWQTWSMALMTFVVVLGSLQTTSDAEKVRTEL